MANGQQWRIEGFRKARSWVARYASTMNLEGTDRPDVPALVYFYGNSENGNRDTDVLPVDTTVSDFQWKCPRDGWKKTRYDTLSVYRHEGSRDVFCELREMPTTQRLVNQYYQALSPVYESAETKKGGVFHSALLVRDGVGVLLVGKSDMGKTTCSMRVPKPWYAPGDDDTLVVPDGKGRYVAHPFPTWSEFLHRPRSQKKWEVQCHVPLAGIFFLDKAARDDIRPLQRGMAAFFLTKAALSVSRRMCYANLAPSERLEINRVYFENMAELSRSVPVFLLSVSLHGKFWTLIEQAIAFCLPSPCGSLQGRGEDTVKQPSGT